MTTNCSKEQCSKVLLSTCVRMKCTCKGSPCATAVIGGETRGAMGATAPPPLNNHLKWLSPLMWANRVLLVASAHTC